MEIRQKALLIMILLMAGCAQLTGMGTTEEPVVGVTTPLTGPFAYYGEQVQMGLDMALQDKPVKIVYYDNEGEPSKAVSDFNKLKEEAVIVISTNTPLTQPLVPLAESSEVNLLALVVGAKDIAKGTNYVFRDAVTSAPQGAAMAKYAKTIGNKAATLVVQDDYGLDAAQAFEEKFEEAGGIIVAKETFDGSSQDYRTQLLRIKQSNADSILFVGREKNLVSGVKQAKEIGLEANILSINAFDSPSVLENEGSQGVIFSSSVPGSDEFRESFIDKYGEEPSIYALDAYAAGEYLWWCLENVGRSRENVNKCLSEEEFETVKGTLSFDDKHDASMKLAIYVARGGGKVRIQ